MITAEFVGGPYDGRIYSLPDGARYIEYAEPLAITGPDDTEPSIRVLRIPVRLTPNGWRLIWDERTR